MDLLVTAKGAVRCVYDEAIEIHELGQIVIRRASHVEPTPCGQWIANLAPVGGPVLGRFALRSAALEAEAAWLGAHWLLARQ